MYIGVATSTYFINLYEKLYKWNNINSGLRVLILAIFAVIINVQTNFDDRS